MSEQIEDSSPTNGEEHLSMASVKPQRKSFSSDHEEQNGNQEEEKVNGESSFVISDPDPSFVEEEQKETDPLDLHEEVNGEPSFVISDADPSLVEEGVIETTTDAIDLDGEDVLVEPSLVISDPDPSFVEETERGPVDLDESRSPLPIDPAVLLLQEEEVPPLKMADEFHLNTQSEEKEEELKTQRDLDEDEVIPPPPSDSVKEDGKSSPSVSIHEEEEEEVLDVRPLTALEDPYGIEDHSHERRNSRPLESWVKEEDEGVVKEEVLIPVIELCQPSFEDVSSIDHSNSQLDPTEILPPLDSLSYAMETTTIIEPEEEEEANVCSPLPFEIEDVLGNKTLLKQTLVSGRENSRPTRSTLVNVCYRLSLVENVDGQCRLIEEVREERFFVGESDILPSIDICVQLMNEGEKALIDSDIRHCYGERGLEEKGIPPTSKDSPSYRMKIELEVQRWSSSPDPQTLQVNERLFWGDKKRERGNFFYRREDFSNAVQCYRGALRFLDLELNPLLSSASVEDRSILIERYIQVENNVAQVNLQLNRFDSCLTAVENVLRYDPTNGKALFRQGKALFQLGRYDLALQSLTKLPSRLTSSSDQESLQQMIQTSRAKIESYQKNEKEIYKRMFQPKTTTPSNRTEIEIGKSSSAWGSYLALGTVALALLAGTFFIIKRRQT